MSDWLTAGEAALTLILMGTAALLILAMVIGILIFGVLALRNEHWR